MRKNEKNNISPIKAELKPVDVMKCIEGIFNSCKTEQDLHDRANKLCAGIKVAHDLRMGEIKAEQAIKAEKALSKEQKQQLGALNACYEMGLLTTPEYRSKYAAIVGEAVSTIEKKAEKPAKAEAKAADTKSKSKSKAAKTEKAEKPAKAEAAKVEQVKISSLTAKQIKAMNIKFEQYSEKCMLMTGSTKSIKDDIKAIGGAHWNAARQGWFLKNENAKVLAKALKIKIS